MIGWLCLLLVTLVRCEAWAEVRLRPVTEPVDHAEGPHWDSDLQTLFFVDISGQAVLAYHPATRHTSRLDLNATVGAVVPVSGRRGEYLVGLGRDVARLSWDGVSHQVSILHSVDEAKVANRFNDGKADPNGHLWIGTMGREDAGGVEPDQGTLYRLSSDCSLQAVLSPVTVSNGMAWTSDLRTMYYIDSPTRRVDAFNFDPRSSTISNRRAFFEFDKYNVSGLPDGMTLDSNDDLWIACYNGSAVIQVDGRTGRPKGRVGLEVSLVTSVAWGGPSLDTLYVTTMRTGLSEQQRAEQPLAGAVWQVTGLGVHGTASNTADCSDKPVH